MTVLSVLLLPRVRTEAVFGLPAAAEMVCTAVHHPDKGELTDPGFVRALRKLAQTL